MAETRVDVVVRVKDLAALERLKKSLAGVEGATLQGERGIKRFENSLKRLQGVLGGLAVGDQLRRAFGAAADFSATEARLTNVVRKYKELAGIQELAAVSARKFGISNAQAASDLADLGSRLGSSGANLKDLNDIYEGFNTLLAVNRVETQQAAAAQLQLNQALGSGKLAGDEFRSISETTPQLLDELASTLGVTRDQIKDLGSEGKITAKVLVEALGNIAKDGGTALADFFKTPAGQLKLFDKAIKDFQVTVGEQLLPVFTPVISSLTTLLELFGQLPGPVKATAVAVTGLAAAVAILGGPVTLISAGIIGLTLLIKKLADENKAVADALKGAWDGVLAALDGLGAFFKTVFSEISKDLNAFFNFWQQVGAAIGQAWDTSISYIANVWNTMVASLTEAWARWQGYFNAVVEAIGKAWNQVVSLLPEAFGVAINALGGLWNSFVEYLSGAFGGILDGFNSLLSSMGLNWGKLIETMITALVPFAQVFKAMGVDLGGALAAGVQSGFQAMSSFEGIQAPTLNLPKQGNLGNTPTPTTGGGSSGGGGGGGGTSEAARQLELQNEQLKAAKDLLFTSENQLKALEGVTETEKLLAEAAIEKLEIERKYQELQEGKLSNEEGAILRQAETNELKANEVELEKALKGLRDSALSSIDEQIAEQQAIIAGKEKEYKIAKQIADLVKGGSGQVSEELATSKVNQLESLKEQAAEAKELEGQYEQIASGIAGEFTDAFRSIIDGTKSVNEAFADMLKGIADKFLDMAAKIIQDQLTQQLVKLFGSLFGGGTNAAAGGGGGMFSSVSQIGGGGLAGNVFEGGGYTGDGSRSGGVDGKGGFPAILHPQETVVDHYGDARNALRSPSGGSAAIDGDAMNSYFADSRAAMTSVSNSYSTRSSSTFEAAQLDGAQQSSSVITVSTNVINEVEYATVDELNRATRAAAKTAEANVYKGMRNMPSKRSRAGMK